MNQYRADLHIHTVLSPCGDLDMSPKTIVHKALDKGLDIIAITDHNTTRMCEAVAGYGAQLGLTVLFGTEVTTSEEVHCICLFKDGITAAIFQIFLDERLPNIANNVEWFGHQVQVDEDENIIYSEPKLLINALRAGIVEIAEKVHQLGGLFIPAHIFRPMNGLIHQLGTVPDNLYYDALEVTEKGYLTNYAERTDLRENTVWIGSSDAHIPEDIGKWHTIISMAEPTFEELGKALQHTEGRAVTGFNKNNV